MPPRPSCLAVGLNPAWQKILLFDRLAPGDVNRARRMLACPAGKSINTARALRLLDTDCAVATFLGGGTGNRIGEWLDHTGVERFTPRCAGATRTCTTLVSQEDGVVTEIIEPSPEVTATEMCELRKSLIPAVPRFDAVGLCGTWPPGADADVYVATARAARPDAVVVLDAWRNVAPVLEGRVDLLKVNASELRRLAAQEDLDQAARHVDVTWNVPWIAVTDGPGHAFLFGAGSRWTFQLPELPGVVNPIGAGDCTTAATLSRCAQLAATRDPLSPDILPETLAYALACACASCLEWLPACFDPARIESIRQGIRVERETLAWRR